MIVWREKFAAFGIHFLATLGVALLAAALIFLVWYPEPFGTMVGGLKLFTLITGCDLVLGPLVSLVVYDSRKTRLALTVDYTVIVVLQLAALVYGIHSVSQARPVYVAFVKDRLEVIAAAEIGEKDLLEARAPYDRLPWRGPRLVATYVKPEDSNDALTQGLEGHDVGVRPKFYVDYASQLPQIQRRLKSLPPLMRRSREFGRVISAALDEVGRPAEDFGWLPVRHPKGFWTVLIDRRTGYPALYVPIDPY